MFKDIAMYVIPSKYFFTNASELLEKREEKLVARGTNTSLQPVQILSECSLKITSFSRSSECKNRAYTVEGYRGVLFFVHISITEIME